MAAPVSAFDQERFRLEAACLEALNHGDNLMENAVVHEILRVGLPEGKGMAVIAVLEPTTPEKERKEELNQDLKVLVEHCLCRLAAKIMRDAVQAHQPLMAYSAAGSHIPTMPRLLDLGLWLSNHAVSDQGMIFTLLEQLLEGSTLNDCQDVFGWVEKWSGMLSNHMLWKRGKLIMLRSCNDLLRRLSKAKNTVLCGRVLITLAQFFELSERSALNLASINNTHNTKVDEDYEDAMETGTDAVEPVDRVFHKEFWGLQAVFQTPQSMLDKDRFSKFVVTLTKVLDAFASQPLRDGRSGSGLTPLDEDQSYAVKYLTSSKLLHLQMRDPAFRRHFLLQCIILMQYCRMPPKPEMAADMGKEQLESIQSMDSRLWSLLEGMPPHGKEFADAARTIMQREKNWVQWKRQVCPAFERKPLPEVVKEPEPVPMRKKGYRPPVNYKVKLGNQELDRLWSLSDDNISVLDSDARKHVHRPSVEDFFAIVVEEADPEAYVEDQYKKKNDTVYKWKAQRLIAKTNLGIFQKWNNQDLDDAMLELFKDKHMPGISEKVEVAVEKTDVTKVADMDRTSDHPKGTADAEMGKDEDDNKKKASKPSRKRSAEES